MAYIEPNNGGYFEMSDATRANAGMTIPYGLPPSGYFDAAISVTSSTLMTSSP